MNNFTAAQLVLLSEIGMVLSIISIIAIIFLVRFRKKERQLTSNVVTSFKQSASQRKEKLLEMMQSTYNLGSDDAEKNMQLIFDREKNLYSKILRVFYRHEHNELSKIQESIAALTQAYESLAEDCKSQQVKPESDSSGEESRLRDKIKVMREENDRLKVDLKQALESVDRIQKEYLAIYEKYNQDDPQASMKPPSTLNTNE